MKVKTSELKPCPFCGSAAKWCGENEPDPADVHICHHIQCTNPSCAADFDFLIKGELLPEDTDGWSEQELLKPLRDECAKRFNQRD